MLIETTGTRQLIAGACEQAAGHGVRMGMTLAQARAICPGLAHREHEPMRDRQALLRLGRWLTRFTPVVSPALPGGLFLDVSGCERLYETRGAMASRPRGQLIPSPGTPGEGERCSGLAVLMEQVAGALDRLRIRARLAIAPSVGAAWAIASFDRQNRRIVTEEDLPGALAPLPPAGLRLEPEICATLDQLGIHTIGQLIKLPRSALPSRFGPAILHQLDAAFGRTLEMLTPLPHPSPITAGIEFDGPVESIEAIWQVLRGLVGQLIGQFVRRGCGARQVEVELRRAYAPPIHRTIRLSRPSRDPANLLNLLRCAFEKIETDAGYIAIHLHVPVFERLSDEQLRLLEQEQHQAGEELARLVERLTTRMGPAALAQPRLTESHLPERAFQWIEPDLSTSRRCLPPAACCLPLPVRPLRLLPTPIEIHAVVTPSHDSDGPPLLFRNGGTVHRIAQSGGPERIAGIWWEGRNKTRDYFDVQDESGRRFWVFRVIESGRWYLHGLFE